MAGTGVMDKQGIATRRQARWSPRAFLKSRRGVAAIEFAMITPLLLVFYFFVMELGQGIETSKKISRVGSMVADLVSQQGRYVETGDLDPIMSIGEAILQPYNRSRADIVITGIEIDKDAKAKVKWSRKMEAGAFGRGAAEGDAATVPDDLKIPETFLLRVTAKLGYSPIVTDKTAAFGLLNAFDDIPMSETYYLRPRMSSDIRCGNC